MSDEKNYDPEMRGVLYADERSKDNDKYPIATGKVTISGVELRVAMWPSRVTSGESPKKYWPIKVEYRQGATRFLVPVEPAKVVATGITPNAVQAAPSAPNDGPAAGGPADIGDLPF